MKRIGQGGLQCRIAEAVDQCIDMLARLAHGALAGIEAGIIGQVGGVKNRGDRDAQALGGGGEDGAQACHGAAVVVDRLDRGLHSVAVVMEAARISTCLPLTMGARLSRRMIWLPVVYSGVMT